MVIIIKEHGRTILYCMAAVLVLGVIFCMRYKGETGFIQIAYKKADVGRKEKNVSLYADTVKKIMSGKKPEITYLHKEILPGKNVNVDKMFTGRDSDGNPAMIKVTDILNPSGESLLHTAKECHIKTFSFPVSGIYTLTVEASDAENRIVCRQYKVPVGCYAIPKR